jgi:hypothetical protein
VLETGNCHLVFVTAGGHIIMASMGNGQVLQSPLAGRDEPGALNHCRGG